MGILTNVGFTMQIPFFSILILISGCSTTRENIGEQDNLDIDSKTEAITAFTPSNSEPGPKAKDVFEWQKHFKSLPAPNDRVKLESQLQQKTGATLTDLQKRARIEFALGKLAKSEATYREILRQDKNNMEALIELASIYFKQKNSENCIKVLSDVKEIIIQSEQPDKLLLFRYRYLLSLVQIMRGNREKGHAILSDLIGIEPSFAPGYSALAASYLAIGKDQVAKFIVERGLDRGIEDPMLFNIMGVVFKRAGKNALARDYFNKALGISGHFAPALINRANLNIESSEMRIAETDLKKALEVDPLNVEAMINLAVVQRQTGRFKQAKEMLDRVIEVSPENAQARFNLALIMKENLKNNTEALRLFREVMQTEDANPDLKNLARAASEELKNL
ncbi:MAG: tetratricopeptide repeat protein [Proteobacteria bacterium]|nr:tetratricopeptide repeat protein [Pseudomonadota bacterium]